MTTVDLMIHKNTTIGIMYLGQSEQYIRRAITFFEQFGKVELLLPNSSKLGVDVVVIAYDGDIPHGHYNVNNFILDAQNTIERFIQDRVPLFGIQSGASLVLQTLWPIGIRQTNLPKKSVELEIALDMWKSKMYSGKFTGYLSQKYIYSIWPNSVLGVYQTPEKVITHWISGHRPIAGTMCDPLSLWLKPESSYFKKSGKIYGDIGSIELFQYLINL